MIQGGAKSEPGNTAQRRNFSQVRSQNRSHSKKTGARAVASNGSKSEEISAKPFPRPALRGGVNSGRDTALSCTLFDPSVHSPILLFGRPCACAQSPHAVPCDVGGNTHTRPQYHRRSGSQAVTCCPEPLPSADAPQRAPADPVAGRSAHLSPPGSDGACTAGFR